MAHVSFEEVKPIDDPEPPVVIIHELLDSKTSWAMFAKELHNESLRKVYAVDARNHGESPHTKDMTYLHMAEDIRKFLVDHKIKTCFLIGHGMGGRAAMTLALKYPSLIDSLIVLDASPVSASPNHFRTAAFLHKMSSIPFKLKKNMPLNTARRAVDMMLSSIVFEQQLRALFVDNLVRIDRTDRIAYKWRVNMYAVATNMCNLSGFPTLDGTPVLDKPALFINGAKTGFNVNLENAELKRMFPFSECLTISKSGHWIHLDNPREFLSIILGYMAFMQLFD